MKSFHAVCLLVVVGLLTACNNTPPGIQSIRVDGKLFEGQEIEVKMGSEVSLGIRAVGGAEGVQVLEVRDRRGSSNYSVYFNDFGDVTEADVNFPLRLIETGSLTQAYMDSVTNAASKPGTVLGQFGLPELSVGQTRQLDVYVRDASNRNHTESLMLKIVE
ncbi:MAG: hypothetical protein AAFV07_18075 [Bacteroidota bacterium]